MPFQTVSWHKIQKHHQRLSKLIDYIQPNPTSPIYFHHSPLRLGKFSIKDWEAQILIEPKILAIPPRPRYIIQCQYHPIQTLNLSLNSIKVIQRSHHLHSQKSMAHHGLKSLINFKQCWGNPIRDQLQTRQQSPRILSARELKLSHQINFLIKLRIIKGKVLTILKVIRCL